MGKKIVIGLIIAIVILVIIRVVAININNTNNNTTNNEINNIVDNNEVENVVKIEENVNENIVTEKNETAEKKKKEEEVENVEYIQIKVNNKILNVKLEDNSSAKAFVEKLNNGDIIVNARDYGDFEKVGPLGFELPTNDTRITTTPGDLILYQGNQITLYYDTNTWSFTKLGKVENISKEELKEILGSGDVELVFTNGKF